MLSLLWSFSFVRGEEAKRWIRPIKQDVEWLIEKDTVKLFIGEWVQTTAKGMGHILFDGDTLLTDPAKITDINQKTDNIVAHAVLVPDSLYTMGDSLYIQFNRQEGVDSIRLIDQQKNEVAYIVKAMDTIHILTKSKLGAIIRVAPSNRLSSWIRIDTVKKVEPVEALSPSAGAGSDDSVSWWKSLENIPSWLRIVFVVFAVFVICVSILWIVRYFIQRFKQGKVPGGNGTQVPGGEDNNEIPGGKEVEAVDGLLGEIEQTVGEIRNNIEKLESQKKGLEQCIISLTTENKSLRNKETTLQSGKERAETEKSQVETKLTEANVRVQKLEADLSTATEERNSAQSEVARLQQKHQLFDNTCISVAYAQEYAQKIKCLVHLSNMLTAHASQLLDTYAADDGSKYYLYKYLGKYSLSVTPMDFLQFYADTDMIASGGFVFKGCSLTELNQDGTPASLESMKQYFFITYLEKYIEALVVLNESLAGLDKITSIKQRDTACFQEYRDQIKNACHDLGIAVKSVKIFDLAVNNPGLQVEPIDFDRKITSGSILEIGNCLVYFEGGTIPQTKIKVKAQQ